MSRYKAKWVDGEPNEQFWKEVLVGRTIKTIHFDDGRLSDIILDDGQRLSIIKNENDAAVLMIKD